MKVVKFIFMGDSAVSFKLVFRTIFTEPPQLGGEKNEWVSSSKQRGFVWIVGITVLAPWPSSTPLSALQSSVMLMPNVCGQASGWRAWFCSRGSSHGSKNNNVRWQNGDRGRGGDGSLKHLCWCALFWQVSDIMWAALKPTPTGRTQLPRTPFKVAHSESSDDPSSNAA